MAAWVTLVWLALWGDLSWGNLLGGVLVSTLVLTAIRLPEVGVKPRIAPWSAALYAVVFARDLCVATFEVSRQVFWPVARLRPAVLAIPLETTDAGLISLVANTITLTPGTLTLEADNERSLLWVHVLHLSEGGEGAIIEQVRGLERLGARALGVALGTGKSDDRKDPS